MKTQDAGPSVSVAMSAYNIAAWIRGALDSALAQTYPIAEILVYDDGSTDTTPEIVKSYGGIVKYHREPHGGRPFRNWNIRSAVGDYVAFLDGDDFWDPCKLESQMSLLLARRAPWAICQTQWLDSATGQNLQYSSLPLPEGDILEPLFLNNFITASSPLVAKAVFDEVGLFDETAAATAAEDWDMWLRVAARFPVATVQQRLTTVRLRTGSILASVSAAQRVQGAEATIERAASRQPLRLGPLKARALANVSFAAGVRSFRQRELTVARSYFMRALRHRPYDPATLAYIGLTLLGPRLAMLLVSLKRRTTKLGSLR